MSRERSLPVLMPDVPNQRWSCHSCGNCCRSLVIHLTAEDRARLDAQAWSNSSGLAAYLQAGRAWVLNKRPDGACVFLDENNRCRIHARHGSESKPLACRIFPFSVRPVRNAWQASLRFDCPSAAASEGDPVLKARNSLSALSAKLEHPAPRGDDLGEFGRGILATNDEIALLINRFGSWLADGTCSLTSRLIGAARVTATLDRSTLENVRGKRFAELLDLLFGTLPKESAVSPSVPTQRQRAMLRQLTFAHSEHVSLAELRSRRWSRIRKRWQQLRTAKRFLAGRGEVPRLPNATRDVAFDSVESVTLPGEPGGTTAELLVRYLTCRLESRSFFGEGYYGCRIFEGLTGLWLSVAVVGWLARYHCAMEGESSLRFSHVCSALAIVDAAATRVPALGTGAERIRRAYLSNDDGVARLIQRYAVCGESN